jgi:hypothetical protein
MRVKVSPRAFENIALELTARSRDFVLQRLARCLR